MTKHEKGFTPVRNRILMHVLPIAILAASALLYLDFNFPHSRTAGVLAALVFVGAVGLAVVALAGKLAGPIENLKEAAEDLGAGNFARRAEVETDDEVGELAKLFNSMAERLGSNFAKTES